MKKVNSLFLVSILFLIVLTGCSTEEAVQEEYVKCTAVCSSVLEDDFVTMELCREECKEKFLSER